MESAPSRHRLAHDAVFSIGGLIAAQCTVAILYTFCARNSTPSDYGRAMAVVSVATVAAAAIDFGSNSYMIREIAAGKLDWEDFSTRYLAKCGVLLAAVLIYTVSTIAINLPSYIVGGAFLAGLLAMAQTSLAPLRGLSRASSIAFTNVTEKILALVAITASVDVGIEAYRVLWIALSIGSSGALLLAVYIWPPELRKTLGPKSLPQVFAANPWKGTLHFGLLQIVTSLQFLDLAVVAIFATPEQAGSYAAVNRWTTPMAFLATGYTQSMYAHVTRAPDHRQAWRLLRFGWRLLPIMGVALLGISLTADSIVRIVLGSAYAASGPVLALLALGVIPGIVNQPLAMFLQARGSEVYASATLAIAMPLHLVLVGVLATFHGAAGAACGLLVAQLLQLALLGVGSRRLLRACRPSSGGRHRLFQMTPKEVIPPCAGGTGPVEPVLADEYPLPAPHPMKR
ncbi:lipopolysaccharide biosynthesis protein [Frankia sp. Cr2]|uniref:lipopolysaccharide biosynthesis protein n=1 Tax=Frankia sp. Cr2 TaxID=3073932 RepID=UPI002AD2AAC4|nr:lipopolysaccharide biosynthesis protein [Frankia sp. Cr2]